MPPSLTYVCHVKLLPTLQTEEGWGICYFSGSLVREIGRCEGHPYSSGVG